MSPKKKEFQKTKQFENVIEKSPSETKVKKDRKPCVKIVEKSIKNHLRNHYGNLLVEMLKKVRPRRPQERQKAIVAQAPRAQGAGKR